MPTAESLEMLRIAATAADAKGGTDLVALDVSEPLPLVDVFLLVSGRSERNVAAIADEIEDEMVAAGFKRLRREGRQESRWVLVDFGDLVVHVFHDEERSFYALASGCGRTARRSPSRFPSGPAPPTTRRARPGCERFRVAPNGVVSLSSCLAKRATPSGLWRSW